MLIIIYIQVQITKIRAPIPSLDSDPDTAFTMIIIEENKNRNLGPWEVGEGIAFILLDEFLEFLNCIEENIVWWSFRIKNFIGKGKRGKQIWTKNEYIVSTDIISRPET